MIPLREYQQEAIDAVVNAVCEGKRRVVVNLPTGTGKTITALSMVASSVRKGNRVLWIAHRDELISQTAESFERVAPDCVPAGIVKAERDEHSAQFVIASVQTLWGRDRSVEKERAELEQALDECQPSEVGAIQAKLNALPAPSFPRWDALKPDTFKFVIYDECHHSISPSAIRLMKTVKPESLILGLSATPFRGDDLSLAALFTDGIVYQMPLKKAIREGYLCDYKYQSVWLDLDLGTIKTTAGDYNAKQLEAALEQAGVVEATVKGIKTHAPNRKGIVFTFTIAQAEATAARLREEGIAATHISDKTSRDDRRRILRDFKSGAVKWIPNCAVLTEGFDEPSCDCVVIARPTKSKPLYTQMAGRGLRLHNGKSDCLILDFVGVGKKNPPAGVVDLIGVIPDPNETSEEAEKRLVAEEEAKGLPKDPVAKAMLEAAERARVERDSWKAAWVVLKVKIPGVVEARVLPGKKRKCIIWTEDGERWKCAAWLAVAGPERNGGVYWLEKKGMNLDFAESVARQAMRDMGQKGIFDSSAAWRIRPPSKAALAMAAKCRIEVGQNWSGGEVADAINAVVPGWDLKALLVKGTQRELFFETPESFRDALRAERDASESEYNEKKVERRYQRQEAE